MQRIDLAPLEELEQSRAEIMDKTVKPYFDANINAYLYKNMVVQIEDLEFYIKYCRPFFGRIDQTTEVKIESSVPKDVVSVRIAPIWETEEMY